MYKRCTSADMNPSCLTGKKEKNRANRGKRQPAAGKEKPKKADRGKRAASRYFRTNFDRIFGAMQACKLPWNAVAKLKEKVCTIHLAQSYTKTYLLQKPLVPSAGVLQGYEHDRAHVQDLTTSPLYTCIWQANDLKPAEKPAQRLHVRIASGSYICLPAGHGQSAL